MLELIRKGIPGAVRFAEAQELSLPGRESLYAQRPAGGAIHLPHLPTRQAQRLGHCRIGLFQLSLQALSHSDPVGGFRVARLQRRLRLGG